jgi:hypothetical protein
MQPWLHGKSLSDDTIAKLQGEGILAVRLAVTDLDQARKQIGELRLLNGARANVNDTRVWLLGGLKKINTRAVVVDRERP